MSYKYTKNLIMRDYDTDERLRRQREDPPTYDSKGRLIHIPDWVYDDMF